MKIENWPNFIIVGSGKSGSTSLYNYLDQHPEIFMSRVKEPGYFEWYGKKPNFNGPKDSIHINSYAVYDEKDYLNLFKASREHKAIGEATVRYFVSDKAAQRIKGRIPDCRIIILIRNPISRAFSSYQMAVRDRDEQLSFLDAVKAKKERQRNNWARPCYLTAGYYTDNIKKYQGLFGSENVLLLFTEDLNTKPTSVLNKIFKFLGVSTDIKIDTTIIHNKSGVPKNKALHYFMTNLDDFVGYTRKFRNLVRSYLPGMDRFLSNTYRSFRGRYQTNFLTQKPMSEDERDFLKSIYTDEIRRLSKLTNRDLSHWLT